MSSSSLDVLFRPFRLKSLDLKNRIVMAPMTRLFAPAGVPGSANATYYRRRAEGGVGLILSEGTVIDRPASGNDPDIPRFYGESALAGWKEIVDEVHAAGGRMGPQIWHTGAADAPRKLVSGEGMESPSGLVAPGVEQGRAMSDADIADTIASFARAAADAKRLGFDTVEIHGAHGYLVDEFFWDETNKRQDRFGGATLAERTRFAVEVTRAVREAVGPDYPVIMRVSQWKPQDYSVRLAHSPSEMEGWLQPLVDAGVDMLHCSQRRIWEPEFPELDGEKGLNFAGWARKLTGVPTISVGSVGLSSDFIGAFRGQKSEKSGLEGVIERMERDEFDLVAVGRALISDPLWVQKIGAREFEQLQDFDPEALGALV